MGRALGVAGAVLPVLVGGMFWRISEPVLARRADEDVVTAAGDALGASPGRESIGLSDDDNARGFSPQGAGNTHIEGLCFNERSARTPAGQEGVTIRVGLTAIGFPLAAPTGVVDRSLRTEGDRLRVGNVTNRFAWVLRGEGCSAPNQARTLAANPAVDL